jgi:tetratricopeptide (TPR) repeat protein
MMKAGLFFVVLSLVAGPCLAAPATDAVIAEVQTALDNGDAIQAKRLASTALEERDISEAQRGRLMLDRGLAQELLGSHTEAMTDFTTAIGARALPSEERAQALLQRGFLLDGLGRLDAAAADYTAVMQLRAGSVSTALNNRANIYRRQNRLAAAQRDYRASLAAGNARPQFSYFGLGQIAETQGDKNAARGFYASAVAADPGYELAVARLAALGGALDNAIVPSSEAASRGADSSAPDPGRIVLHPPKAVFANADSTPSAQPIVLHMPHRQGVTGPSAAPSRAKPVPVGPGLRPALDDVSTPAPKEQGGPQVQLGAWRSAAEADQAWKRAQARAGAVLEGLAWHVVAADLPGKGRYYRLRVSSPDPARLCATLSAKGLDCMRARD